MQDAPTGLDIIDAVIERLSTVVAPALSGRLKFEVRVAERALRLAHRDLSLSQDLKRSEQKRLTVLLGPGAPQNLVEANRALCQAIDSGSPEIDRALLLSHLRATTIEKLTVDQPDYPPLKKGLSD
jgi:hypothetical protein